MIECTHQSLDPVSSRSPDDLVLPASERVSHSYSPNVATMEFLLQNGFLDMTKPITVDQIKSLHKFVCSHNYFDDKFHKETPELRRRTMPLNPGRFRDRNFQNRHAFSLGSDAAKIPAEMEAFVQRLNQLENLPQANPGACIAAESYLTLIDIHPFGDGNGRVSRLLLNTMLLRHGQPAIDLALINWHNAELVGFAQSPGDREFLSQLISDAASGRDCREAVRQDRQVGDTFKIDRWEKASPGELLGVLRGYIGAAFPTLSTLKKMYWQVPFSSQEKNEFVGILRAGERRAAHPITRREIGEALDYFPTIAQCPEKGAVFS